MADQESVWYRIGYGLEQARGSAPRGLRLRSLTERRQDKVTSGDAPRPAGEAAGAGGEQSYEAILAALAAALGSKALRLVPARRRPGIGRLVKAGAAGAGAAVLRELLRPLVAGRADGRSLEEAVQDAAVAGAARGLLYGSLVEPRLPGPSLLRGLAFGYVEYLASPYGGLTGIAGASAPHRQVPMLASLFEDLPPGEDTLADHLAYGVALALLYGADDVGRRGEDGEAEAES